MSKYRNIHKTHQGQVALEYVLATTIVMALGFALFLFYQGFVQANLYGHAGNSNRSLFNLAEDYKAVGLERVVSMPVP